MAKSTIQLFRDRYDDVKGDWDSREELYKTDYLQLMGHDIGREKPWGAKVNSQHTHSQVMTWTAFVHAGLLSTYPWFFVEANEPFREIESRGTEEFNRRLRNIGYYKHQYMWLRLAATLGLGVNKLVWNEAAGRPEFKLIHPGNIAWDKNATTLRGDCEWVIERSERLTLGMIEAMAKRSEGWKPDAVKKLRTVGEDIGGAEQEQKDQRRRRSGEGIDEEARLTLHFMVTAVDMTIVYEEMDLVLFEQENPYGFINYYDLQAFPENFEIDGWSIPELGRDIQDEINTTLRQKIDISSLCANPMLKLKRSAGINPFGQTASPGKMWLVNESDDLESFNLPDTSQGLMEHLAYLSAEYDRLVGVMPMTRGEQGRPMKATVASLIHGNTNTKFAVEMNMIQDYPLRTMMADYMQLCALDDNPVAVTPGEWSVLRNLVGSGDLWMVPHAEAYVGNAVEKFQLLMQFLQIAGTVLDPPAIAEVVKEMIGLIQIRDPERISKGVIGNMRPDPVAGQAGAVPTPGALQESPGMGRGVGMAEEAARSLAPGQPAMSPPVGV